MPDPLSLPSLDGADVWGATINAALDDLAARIDNAGALNGQVAVFDSTGQANPSDFLHARSHGPGGADRVVVHGGHESPARLDTMPRMLPDGISVLITGNVDLAYVTSNIGKTVDKLRVVVGSTGYTAGTGGPPTARLGLYTVASNGNLTLVARTATIAAASFAANTVVEAVLDGAGGYPTSYDLLHGTRYALAIIWTDNGATGHVIPQLARFQGTGPNTTVLGTMMSWSPRMTGRLTGQTDLPASITAGSVTNTATLWWVSAFNSADSGV